MPYLPAERDRTSGLVHGVAGCRRKALKQRLDRLQRSFAGRYCQCVTMRLKARRRFGALAEELAPQSAMRP